MSGTHTKGIFGDLLLQIHENESSVYIYFKIPNKLWKGVGGLLFISRASLPLYISPK